MCGEEVGVLGRCWNHFIQRSSTPQASLLGEYFMGDRGVNYRQFLDQLAPNAPIPELYSSRIDTVRGRQPEAPFPPGNLMFPCL